MLSENSNTKSLDISLHDINDMNSEQLTVLQQTVTIRLKEEHNKKLLANINSVELEKNHINNAIVLHESRLIELKLQISEEERGLAERRAKLTELEEESNQLLQQARVEGLIEYTNLPENIDTVTTTPNPIPSGDIDVTINNYHTENIANDLSVSPLPPTIAYPSPEAGRNPSTYGNTNERQIPSSGGMRRYDRQRSSQQPRPCQVLPEPFSNLDYYNTRSTTSTDTSNNPNRLPIQTVQHGIDSVQQINSSSLTDGILPISGNGLVNIQSCSTTSTHVNNVNVGQNLLSTVVSGIDLVPIVSARRTLSLTPILRPMTFRSAEAEDVPSSNSSQQYPGHNRSSGRDLVDMRSRVGYRWRNVRSSNPFMWRGNAVLDDSEADIV